MLDVLEGYDVTLVEVGCAPSELARCERARGNRPAGLTASQTEVYGFGHDIRVDTTDTSPEACARTIADLVATLSPPKAFDGLRANRT